MSRDQEITFGGTSNIIIAGQRLGYIGGKSVQLNSVKTKTILLVSTMLLPPGILLPGQAVAQTRPASQASAPVPPDIPKSLPGNDNVRRAAERYFLITRHPMCDRRKNKTEARFFAYRYSRNFMDRGAQATIHDPGNLWPPMA
ncbi:MAG: hypothetical protein EOP67_09245 [Sphingomonas sp.]|nr:MAG: hypothetical protein EOP67_09245 [Sphingomonas sp.]